MKARFGSTIILVCLWTLCVSEVFGQSRTVLSDPERDPRGPVDVTVCSQNLFNFGNLKNAKKRIKGLTGEKLREKREALAKRFLKADCDIIAFQEALGKAGKGLEEGMDQLVATLKKVTGRSFKYILGDGEDRYMHVGYLYSDAKISLVEYSSFRKIELPKLIEEDRPQLFSRAPLEATFTLNDGENKSITLINIHFKSKSKGDLDPAQLDWETTRMQMSEVVRRVLANKHKKSLIDGEPILMVLGDRNSHFDSASALILEGRLALKDFKQEGACRLSKSGVPLCEAGTGKAQLLFSVLTRDPQVRQLEGTHRFKKSYSWLDDILLPSASLRYAIENPAREGDFSSGVVFEPKGASDHALVWVKLNW